VPDFYNSGGVPAVMKHLAPLIETDALTCTGSTWGEILDNVPEIENDIIHSMSNPWHPWGSLAVLKGNLAPAGAVTKPTAIHKSMQVFKGKAICFNSEEEATEAILNKKILPGMVVVIRYEGPKGGPGMREMVRVMKMLYGQNLALSTAVITDGRFSGTNNGCFVGHISPEAYEGGPIAAVSDGDTIYIDVPNGNIMLEVPQEELERRLSAIKKPDRKIPAGYLNVYARLAESADKGAIIKNR
jgi:dihydroxy-acid dehydratase